MNGWREVVGKAVSEARLILKEEGWPTDPETLREGGRRGSVGAALAARVISYADELERAVKVGNTELALNLIVEVIECAEEACYTAKVPELNGWLIGDITSDIYKTINGGLAFSRTRKRGVAKRNQEFAKARAEEWDRWSREAEKIRKLNPRLSKREIAIRVKHRLKLTEHPVAVARRFK